TTAGTGILGCVTSDVTSPSGIDLTHLDPAVRVQDDLFTHVNGAWLTGYEIPADRAVDGAFRTLYDRAELDVQEIIRTAAGEPGSDARKIADLYASFMDTESVEAAGLTPVADELRALAATTDRGEFAALIGRLQRTGVSGAVAVYVDTDDKNSQRYLVNATQSGIGLPDESYYRSDEYAEVRERYIAHIDRMFALAAADPVVAELLDTQSAG